MNFMNKYKIFILFSLFVSFSFIQKDSGILNLCEQMNNIPKNSIHTFDIKYLSNIKKGKLKLINKTIYEVLFERKKTNLDKSYIINQFDTSKSRKALLVLNYFPECDHEKKEIVLFIIENCKKVIARYQISYVDNEGTIYEVTSKLSYKNDFLTINLDTSSEWAMENESKIDTIFSENYKIKLTSLKLDTIQKKSYLKLSNTN